MTATLVLYFVLQGKMQVSRLPVIDMQTCKAHLLEANGLSTSPQMRLVHAECVERKAKNGR